MLELAVHAILAYLACPALVYFAVGTMDKYADVRSPKIWWAVAAGVYGMLSVVLGMVQGALTAADIGNRIGLMDPWWAILLGIALSLAVSFLALLTAENRYYAKHTEILE